MKSPESQSAMDRAILRVSAPIEVAAATHRARRGRRVGRLRLPGRREGRQRRLSYDNARLRERVHSLEQAEAENRQLKRLLQLRDSMQDGSVSAQVISKDFTEFFRVTRIVLDKGAREVRPHMPVVAPDGVVGGILHVAGDTADVQLAVDAAFGVDVEDERTHARGFVRGTGDPARYCVQGRDGRLARRSGDRRSARDQRQGPVVSARAFRLRASPRSSSVSSAATRTSMRRRPSTSRAWRTSW